MLTFLSLFKPHAIFGYHSCLDTSAPSVCAYGEKEILMAARELPSVDETVP